MKFEKTNENITVNKSFTGKNENYQYDFQVGTLNGKLVSVTCVIYKLEDTEMPNPEGDPVLQKYPERLGYISQLDSVKKMDIPATENTATHVAVFEDFLSGLE